MGAVPLLTREGEVDLARRMERGKLRMQKAISRSALVQLAVVDVAEHIRKGSEELENVVDVGEFEEGAEQSKQRQKREDELRQQFADFVSLQKKQTLMQEKYDTSPLANKKARKKAYGKWMRAKVETSLAIRRIPFILARWKDFSKEIERAVDELTHLDRELKKTEVKTGPVAQQRSRELKREIKKRELTAGAPLGSEPQAGGIGS